MVSFKSVALTGVFAALAIASPTSGVGNNEGNSKDVQTCTAENNQQLLCCQSGQALVSCIFANVIGLTRSCNNGNNFCCNKKDGDSLLDLDVLSCTPINL